MYFALLICFTVTITNYSSNCIEIDTTAYNFLQLETKRLFISTLKDRNATTIVNSE